MIQLICFYFYNMSQVKKFLTTPHQDRMKEKENKERRLRKTKTTRVTYLRNDTSRHPHLRETEPFFLGVKKFEHLSVTQLYFKIRLSIKRSRKTSITR